jgi:hypothetical protein
LVDINELSEAIMTSSESAHTPTQKDITQRTTQQVEGQSLDQEIPLPTLTQQAKVVPRLLTPQGILQLQRTIGNQAVQRLIANQSFTSEISTTPIIQRLVFDWVKASGDTVQIDTTTLENLNNHYAATYFIKHWQQICGNDLTKLTEGRTWLRGFIQTAPERMQ